MQVPQRGCPVDQRLLREGGGIGEIGRSGGVIEESVLYFVVEKGFMTVVCWGKKELLAKSPRSQLCLKVVCWGKKELLAKSPRSQLCLKVVCWGKKELLAKSPRSQLCLKVVCCGKKELLAKSPRSQLCLKVVCWGKKDLLAKTPRFQLCLKVVCRGKKELLATSTNQRCQTCLIFEEHQQDETDSLDNQKRPASVVAWSNALLSCWTSLPKTGRSGFDPGRVH
uniref:Uncharacterized protein n=1 Tax=Timema genevievae TaxID=629358 RepID=A0A7R9K2M2_TIMGE|nr:unnamed protein product [Timema genevievae]